MASVFIEIERELNDINYLVEVEVFAYLVDESFDHAFGTESAWGIELDSLDVITVYDQEGNVVTSRKIIQQLENIIDLDDSEFKNLDFDFSE